jgi:acetyl-CoA/propionyl-CoA carboxylase carboxyl transferase subunit
MVARGDVDGTPAQFAGGVNRALEICVVDDVIKPKESRRRIAVGLAGGGRHGTIPL